MLYSILAKLDSCLYVWSVFGWYEMHYWIYRILVSINHLVNKSLSLTDGHRAPYIHCSSAVFWHLCKEKKKKSHAFLLSSSIYSCRFQKEKITKCLWLFVIECWFSGYWLMGGMKGNIFCFYASENVGRTTFIWVSTNIKHTFIRENIYLIFMCFFSDPADCLLQASNRHISILCHLS